MPKIDSVFSQFKDLDKLSVADINLWLKTKEQNYTLENYIGNKMLYPQTVPIDAYNMDIDLAIIREYIRAHIDSFYSQSANKIGIPYAFVERFPPLVKMIKIVLDVISPLTTCQLVLLKKDTQMYIGMIVRSPHDEDFTCMIDNQTIKILGDSVAVVSTQKQEVSLKMAGHEEMRIPAGEIGLIFDTRVRK